MGDNSCRRPPLTLPWWCGAAARPRRPASLRTFWRAACALRVLEVICPIAMAHAQFMAPQDMQEGVESKKSVEHGHPGVVQRHGPRHVARHVSRALSPETCRDAFSGLPYLLVGSYPLHGPGIDLPWSTARCRASSRRARLPSEGISGRPRNASRAQPRVGEPGTQRDRVPGHGGPSACTTRQNDQM